MKHYYLDHSLRPGEHDFAIIDRMKHPDFVTNWPVQELVSPMLKPQAHLYPWLLPLKEMNAEEWNALLIELERTSSPISSLLIRSNRPIAEVRSQLIRALHFTDENNQLHILRYYDPRVLFHLCWMLTPYLLASTLPIREIPHWTFLLEGKWHTLSFPTDFTWKPGDPSRVSIDQLQRCGVINKVLEKIPAINTMDQRQQTSQRIDVLLSKAIELQLSNIEDQIAFAFYGLTQRDSFWTAPKMVAFLKQARQFPETFLDETQKWDADYWQVMTER